MALIAVRDGDIGFAIPLAVAAAANVFLTVMAVKLTKLTPRTELAQARLETAEARRDLAEAQYVAGRERFRADMATQGYEQMRQHAEDVTETYNDLHAVMRRVPIKYLNTIDGQPLGRRQAGRAIRKENRDSTA